MHTNIVIGLEIHVQLNTEHKLFCQCLTRLSQVPNTNTCPICLGYPGVMPKLNTHALNKALQFALICKSNISSFCFWDRKHYFYPDLPKGYQITQFNHPLATGGRLQYLNGNNQPESVLLQEIHLEEDAGKSIHDKDHTSIDFNRAGVPLLEIVTTPSISSVQQASDVMKGISDLVAALHISNGDLQNGNVRCDVNLSLTYREQQSPRIEIKNLNSFRFVRQALTYKIKELCEQITVKQPINSTTCYWDETTKKTITMRTKEGLHDYRYLPEIDLTPYPISSDMLSLIAKNNPYTPFEKYTELRKQYKLQNTTCAFLSKHQQLQDLFFSSISYCSDSAQALGSLIENEIQSYMKQHQIENIPISLTGRILGNLVATWQSKEISHWQLKQNLNQILQGKKITHKKLRHSDNKHIEDFVTQLIAQSPQQVLKYKQGNKKIIGYFIGQTIQVYKQQVDPQQLSAIIMKLLENDKID